MKYYIIRTNHAIPIGYYRFIHVGYIFEGPVAEPDDIGMVKVCVGCKEHPASIKVSIRPTTGIKPLYTTIATVTMNLIVSAAIVLLNPYVTVYISYKIPPFALSVHIPDVSTSIYVEVDSKVLLGLPSCDKAFVR